MKSSSSVVQGALIVGVYHRRADLGGEADGLLQIVPVDVRPADRSVALQPGNLQSEPLGGAADPPGVVPHGHGVVIGGLAHELAAPVDHRLDVLVAQLGRLLDAPLEGLLVAADRFHIHADGNLTHDGASLGSVGRLFLGGIPALAWARVAQVVIPVGCLPAPPAQQACRLPQASPSSHWRQWPTGHEPVITACFPPVRLPPSSPRECGPRRRFSRRAGASGRGIPDLGGRPDHTRSLPSRRRRPNRTARCGW